MAQAVNILVWLVHDGIDVVKPCSIEAAAVSWQVANMSRAVVVPQPVEEGLLLHEPGCAF